MTPPTSSDPPRPGAPRPGGRDRADDRGSLLDFSLGAADGEEEAIKPRHRAPRPPASPERRRRLRLALLAALLLAGAAAYLLWRSGAPRFRIAPAALRFGSQRVGTPSAAAKAAITNGGSRRLEIHGLHIAGDAAAEFTLAGNGCDDQHLAAGASCGVAVTFVPHQPGERTARLEIEGNALDAPGVLRLSGVGIAPRLALERNDLDFGTRTVGEPGPAQGLELANRGTAPLAVGDLSLAGDAAGDYEVRAGACTGRTVAPGDRCAVELRFRPQAAGERRAHLEVASDGGAPATVTLHGVGLWSGPAVTLAPDRLAFGEEVVGRATEPSRITVTNRTSQAIALGEVRVSGDHAFTVAAQSCAGRSLAPGAGCPVTVRFAPGSEGPVRGSLEIARPGQAGATVVPLAGTGVVPRLTPSVASLAFGDRRLGRRAATLELTVESSGSATIAIERIAVAGPGAAAFEVKPGSCAGATLAPKSRCALSVAFAPSAEAAYTATLSLASPTLDRPLALPISGTGVAPHFAAGPDELDFGRVRRSTTRGLRVTVKNSGTAPLHLEATRFSGPDASDFAVGDDDCAGAQGVPAGGRCSLEVRFSPGEEGPRSARLILAHDAAERPVVIALTGTGLPPPVPALTLDPERLDFGDQPVGERSSISTVTLSNPGTGRLDLAGFRVEGPQADEFQIVPGSCAGFLAPGSRCTVGLRFVPKAGGDRNARLVVRHDAARGSSSVALAGRGLTTGSPQ